MDFDFDWIDYFDTIDEAHEAQHSSRQSVSNHGRDILDKIMQLDDVEFKMRFRMTKSTFRLLVETVIFCDNSFL